MPDFVTLAEARSWLNTEAECDPILQIALDNATDAVVKFLNYNPESYSDTEMRNGTGSDSIAVDRFPVTDVEEVRIGPVVVPGERIVWGQNVIYRTDGGIFDRGRKNVAITYTAGYIQIPGTIKQATLLTTAAIFNSRTIDPNITGESVVGVYSAGFWPTGVGTIPPGARDLLGGHRAVWRAP